MKQQGPQTYGLAARRTNDLGLFGTSEQAFTRAFRWLELADGATALAVRDLAPEPAVMTSALVAVDQQYAWSVLLPAETGTTRFDCFWVEARAIGLDVPDSFAVDSAIRSMGETAAAVDAFVVQEGL